MGFEQELDVASYIDQGRADNINVVTFAKGRADQHDWARPEAPGRVSSAADEEGGRSFQIVLTQKSTGFVRNSKEGLSEKDKMGSWALAIPSCWKKQKINLAALSWAVCERMCGETFLGKNTACEGLKGQEKGEQNEAFRALGLCVRTTFSLRTESPGLIYCNETLAMYPNKNRRAGGGG